MHRRTLLAGAAGAASLWGAAMTPAEATASALDALPLQKSPRLPVLFLGHGSPMNAIEDNEYRRSWQALGAEFGAAPGAKYPKPQLILCISAHWITRGWWLTGMDKPKTIHDFGGFPQALFDVQYPVPGEPDLARAINTDGPANLSAACAATNATPTATNPRKPSPTPSTRAGAANCRAPTCSTARAAR